MSFSSKKQPNFFKQVDVGQTVVLNDNFMKEHHRDMKLEAIVLQTMQNAEDRAVRIVTEADAQAKAILEQAYAQAQQIVEEQGIQQRDAILQEGYAAGYQQGVEEGYLKATTEVADKLALADTILEKTFEAERMRIKEFEPQLVTLLRHVAKLILVEEIRIQPEHIANMIDRATERLHYTGHAKLLIHPKTLRQLQECAPGIMQTLSQVRHLRFHGDESCGPYEIYLEGVDGSYNLSPDSQCDAMIDVVETHLLADAPRLDDTPFRIPNAYQPPALTEPQPEPVMAEIEMLDEPILEEMVDLTPPPPPLPPSTPPAAKTVPAPPQASPFEPEMAGPDIEDDLDALIARRTSTGGEAPDIHVNPTPTEEMDIDKLIQERTMKYDPDATE